ncbi:hypothetical protein [Hydrogenobaculum acidophilum]
MEKGKATNVKEKGKSEEAKDKFQNPLEALYLGKKVTIQGRSIRYAGTLVKAQSGFIHLINATIIGTQHEVKVDILSVSQNLILHIHTPATEIKKIQKEEEEKE